MMARGPSNYNQLRNSRTSTPKAKRAICRITSWTKYKLGTWKGKKVRGTLEMDRSNTTCSALTRVNAYTSVQYDGAISFLS